VICQASFHRWRYSQRLMDAAEIMKSVVDRNHAAVILEFLGERICEPRESPDTHAEIQILPPVRMPMHRAGL